jgi:hypothetical protein
LTRSLLRSFPSVGLHVGRLFLSRRKDLGDGSTQQKTPSGRLFTPSRVLMRRRFTKRSKTAPSPTPANSHRANARSGIFAGRQKGGKRQHKATANLYARTDQGPDSTPYASSRKRPRLPGSHSSLLSYGQDEKRSWSWLQPDKRECGLLTVNFFPPGFERRLFDWKCEWGENCRGLSS